MSKQKEHSSDKDKLITTEQQLKATIQQLQATNQQLRASQEEIQALAKLPSENPNPVLRISADGIILYANEASAPVLETWECKKGQRLPDNCYKRVEKVVNSGEISGFEFACRNDRIFSVTLAPIVDAGYVNAYGLDITERKQAEEQLRASERELKDAQHIGHVGSWDLNVKTGDLKWSDETFRIYGFEPQEFVPTFKKFTELVHPDDLQFVQREVNAALENRKKYNIDFRFVRPGGEVGWIHCEGRVTRDKKGNPIQFFGTQIDITERKQAEEALRDSEALYLSLVENLPQNIFRKDLEGRHIFANENYCRTLKRTMDEIIGKTNYDLFPAELAEKYCRDDQRVIETGEIFDTVEEHELPDGKRIYVQVVKTPLHDSTGKIIGTQGIFWDVTERKLAESGTST